MARDDARYVCRRCSQRPPLPLATGVGRQRVCGHCGSLMVRRSLLPVVGTLLMGGGLVALSLLALPDALKGLAVVASGTPEALRASADPYVVQFLHGSRDGPVQFHQPAPPIEQDLGLTR